jgi:hypothetical protein
MAGALDQHLSRAPHGRHRRAEPGPLPHRPRGDLLRPHNAQVELRLVALVSNVVRHHIHGVADDDLAFNPGHAISCAPDLFPSDPAVCTTGRGKGPMLTPPRHTRARMGTGVQGRAIAASTPVPASSSPTNGSDQARSSRRRPTARARSIDGYRARRRPPEPVPPHRADGRHRATPTGGITLSDREVRENPRRAVVICSPIWGVHDVAAEGFLLRRGHVICSGVSDADALVAPTICGRTSDNRPMA